MTIIKNKLSVLYNKAFHTVLVVFALLPFGNTGNACPDSKPNEIRVTDAAGKTQSIHCATNTVTAKWGEHGITIENICKVELGTAFTSIWDGAFRYCRSLREVTLPEKLRKVWSSVFHRCTGLTKLNLPASCTSIGLSAFEGCTSLMDVTLPEGLESIMGCTFSGCTSLVDVILAGPREIGRHAFYGCRSLRVSYLRGSGTSGGMCLRGV